MSLLAALVLAAATARVEAVNLTTVDSRLAVRVALSGRPGLVAVHREGTGARVSITDAELGGQFAGGSHFAWTPADGFDPALLAAPIRLDRIEVVATAAEVNVLLRVPPDVSIDVRRDPRGLLLVFREGSPAVQPPTAARAAPRAPPATPPPPPETSPEPPAAPPSPGTPPPADVEPEALTPSAPPPPPATPSPDTAELARSLFPAAAGGAERGSVDELYPQLFPGGPPQTVAETVEPAVEPMGARGVPFGPLRIRGGIDARYVDADTFIEGPQSATRERYVEVVPRIIAEAPLSDGRFEFEYAPTLRAFATDDKLNSTSHRLSVGLDLPVGPSVMLYMKDSFVSGVLETREVDPGGEYFFGLGHFRRNMLGGGASIVLGPRLSLELRAATSAVRFQEESSFFDYDSRLASAGLGYELTPTLKTTLSYSYDTVPPPEQREQATAAAHNAQVTFSGDILPLMTGALTLGYRDQKSPNAAAGGTRYQGFTMGGSVTKQFSRESNLTLFVNRSTPVSAFEDNAFYVFTTVQGSARIPLPLEFQLRGGLGYQWNDYRTVAIEIGAPREDRVLGYDVGLRRAVLRQLFLSAAYRREERTSNIERFNTDSDGFIFQLEWDIFGSSP